MIFFPKFIPTDASWEPFGFDIFTEAAFTESPRVN